MSNARPQAVSIDCALLGFRLLVALLIGIHGWYRLHAGTSPLFGDWLARAPERATSLKAKLEELLAD